MRRIAQLQVQRDALGPRWSTIRGLLYVSYGPIRGMKTCGLGISSSREFGIGANYEKRT